MSVAGMLLAWSTLVLCNVTNDLTIKGVCILAGMVEPRNDKGLRTTPVRFKSGKVLQATNLERRLENILDAANRGAVTPTEFYKEFQEIHPFEDGNGRLGLILFNHYNQTLDNPAPKPEVVFSP